MGQISREIKECFKEDLWGTVKIVLQVIAVFAFGIGMMVLAAII